MKLVSIIWIVFILLFLSIGCSEINDDITPSPTIGVHPEGFGDASSPNFHKFVFAKDNWSLNLRSCQKCHTADYTGGTANKSCLGCHTEADGPEACNTCHGVFANSNYIAPPVDLEGNVEVSARGVGAHFKHVYDTTGVSINYGCFDCHQETVGNDLFVHAHIAPPPAKMSFGKIAYPDSLALTPTWNNDLTCSNTYCHGAFKFGNIQGNNYNPLWTSTTETEAQCGTCHGEIDAEGNLVTPLPKGHSGSWTIEQCTLCHSSVVDAEGKIIDKLKHINKKADF